MFNKFKEKIEECNYKNAHDKLQDLGIFFMCNTSISFEDLEKLTKEELEDCSDLLIELIRYIENNDTYELNLEDIPSKFTKFIELEDNLNLVNLLHSCKSCNKKNIKSKSKLFY